ncbi:MAG: hypothetical protein SPL41_02090, partial [Succinivibrionaceae bacterium]|nr:hypothetical protein [Succinivibrionaceae bacterium]
ADPDADALHQLDYVAELLGVNGTRERVCDLVEGEESLLASFLCKEGYRCLAPILTVRLFLHKACYSIAVRSDRMTADSISLPHTKHVKNNTVFSVSADPA